jgi:ABC-type Zn uptake system ZnuABC Zn-binding protein ZnuA
LLLAVGVWSASAAGPAAPNGQAPTPTMVPLTPAPLEPNEKLRVLATTSIVGDVVRQVGDDAIDLKVLLPLSADPHSFQATPRDLAAAADAHVIFANGAGLEQFLDKMLKNAGGNAAVIYVSDGIPLRRLAAEQSNQDEQAGDDPHTWFSPAGVKIWVDNITRALSGLDPAHAADYQARAQSYGQALDQLDAWIKEQVAQIPPEKRILVTDHLTFGYFADRYGFRQVGAVIPSFSSASQPSAQEMAQLENAIRQHGVKAVFVSNVVNPSLSKRVAYDTGIRLVTVYAESLGPTGSGAESYLDFMRFDTQAIVNALK